MGEGPASEPEVWDKLSCVGHELSLNELRNSFAKKLFRHLQGIGDGHESLILNFESWWWKLYGFVSADEQTHEDRTLKKNKN